MPKFQRERIRTLRRSGSYRHVSRNLDVRECLAHKPKCISNRLEHGPVMACSQDAIPLDDSPCWFHDRHLLVALLLETRLSSGSRPCPRSPSRRSETSEAALHSIVVPVGFHRIDRVVVRCLEFQLWDAPISSESLEEIA